MINLTRQDQKDELNLVLEDRIYQNYLPIYYDSILRAGSFSKLPTEVIEKWIEQIQRSYEETIYHHYTDDATQALLIAILLSDEKDFCEYFIKTCFTEKGKQAMIQDFLSVAIAYASLTTNSEFRAKIFQKLNYCIKESGGMWHAFSPVDLDPSYGYAILKYCLPAYYDLAVKLDELKSYDDYCCLWHQDDYGIVISTNLTAILKEIERPDILQAMFDCAVQRIAANINQKFALNNTIKAAGNIELNKATFNKYLKACQKLDSAEKTEVWKFYLLANYQSTN